jgi:hypothetical protein
VRLATCGRGALQLVALSCFLGTLAAGQQAQAQATMSWGRVKATYHGEGLVVHGDGSENSSIMPHVLTDKDPPPSYCHCLEPRFSWVRWDGGLHCFPPLRYLYVALPNGRLCTKCIGPPDHGGLVPTPMPFDDGYHAAPAHSKTAPSEASEGGGIMREPDGDRCALLYPLGKWVERGELTPEDCNPPYSYFESVEFFLGPRCVTCVENVCD